MKFKYNYRRDVDRDDVFNDDLRECGRSRRLQEGRYGRRFRYMNEEVSNVHKYKKQLRDQIDNGANAASIDISQLTDLSCLFKDMESFNQDISEWDTSHVTNMDSMFFNAKKFNQDLYWDVRNVKTMDSMLCRATSFNNKGKGLDWDTSNVTDMDRLFCGAKKFNQPIGNWNVSNVTSMEDMFYGAAAFDQDIGEWDVGNVEDMSGMFQNAVKFNNGGQPMDWDVRNVFDANEMFMNAVSFCQDISEWEFRDIESNPRKFLTGATAWLNKFATLERKNNRDAYSSDAGPYNDEIGRIDIDC